MNDSPTRTARCAAARRQALALGLLATLMAMTLPACGGGEAATQETPAAAATATADVAVLMLGNSHTVGAGLPDRLQAALQAALPSRQVLVVVAPSSAFLDEHLRDPGTLALLAARRWQAVVLQAQKYSSSGLFSHSTAEAEELVRRARAQGAVPVLFPEWSRRGIAETGRIWALHAGIAGREPACVAPIPQAWDAALVDEPSLPLHAGDGNHAADLGSQLTALVLTATLTRLSPELLPHLPGGGAGPLQQRLRQAAAQALTQHDPRATCPGDAPVR